MSMDSIPPGAEQADALEALLEQHSAEQLRYFWRNFTVNVLCEAFWGFALTLVSATAVLPVYISSLGARPALLALLPAVQYLGFGLLQLPGAFYAIRLPRKREWFLGLHSFPILCWFGVAAVAQHARGLGLGTALALSLLGIGGQSLLFGAVMPMWGDFVNRQMPQQRRGRMFGVAFAVGAAAGLAAGAFTTGTLEAHPGTKGFAICFLVAAIAMTVGIAVGFIVHEPAAPFAPTRMGVREFVGHLREAVAQRPGLRRLLLARIPVEAGIMAGPYLAVYAQQRAGLGDEAAGTFAIALTLGQAVASPLVGWLGDRRGYKLPLVLGTALSPVALGLMLGAQRAEAFTLIFVLLGAAILADWLSTMNLVIELCPEADKTIYQALYGTLVIPQRLLYPLLAGLLVSRFDMRAVFGVTLAVQLLGLAAVALVVRDPRAERAEVADGVTE